MTPAFEDEFVTIHHGDCLDVMRVMEAASVDAIVTDPPAGISFMGAAWDGDKGGRNQWIAWMAEIAAEALRVAKPGAHALVWALPRTSHWTATAWEDAGWEVRDRIGHIFGTGFPKSLDVGRAIDKAAGAERESVAVGSDGATRKPRAMAPGGAVREAVQTVSAPATEAAAKWDGWGTALKPAVEDWWLLRKPLGSTVAACVLKHGTGALNIGACRIEGSGGGTHCSNRDAASGKCMGHKNHTLRPTFHGADTMPQSGRWPSHLTHDGSEEVLAVFPEAESGSRAPGVRSGMGYHGGRGDGGPALEASSGSVARFFYCSKPPTAERDDGMCGGSEPDDDGSIRPRPRPLPRRNTHPTVKPMALMRWLVRLITPPGGTVFDPFMGSGTTLKAARAEGFKSIGVDLDARHCEIARERMSQAVMPLTF